MYVTEIQNNIWTPVPQPWQLVPLEYQGLFLMVFLGLGVVAVLYGFWLIATDPNVGKPEPVRRRK